MPRTRRARWGHAFRVVENELHWLVPFGETRAVCGDIVFEDLLPPAEYGGVESPLGNPLHCYGIHLRLDAVVVAVARKRVHATARTIVQCGPLRPT